MWHLVGHWRLPDKYKLLHLIHEGNDGALPSKFRRKLAPKIWYFMVNSGAVFFLPFLGLYWRKDRHFTTRQIGIIQALRPWVSAAAGYLMIPLADAFNIHFIMLLLTFGLTMISRGLMTMDWPYGIMLVLSLIMESAVSPMSILVDATVVAGSVKDGTYGRARLWASIGWGGFAPVAGWVLGRHGIHATFMIFVIIYSIAFIPTLLIPAGLLHGCQRRLSTCTTVSSSSDGLPPPRSSIESGGGGFAPTNAASNDGAKKPDAVVVVVSSSRRRTSMTSQRKSSSHHHQISSPSEAENITPSAQEKRRTTDPNRPIIHLAVDAQSTQSIPEIIILSETYNPDTNMSQQQPGNNGSVLLPIKHAMSSNDHGDTSSLVDDGKSSASIGPKSSTKDSSNPPSTTNSSEDEDDLNNNNVDHAQPTESIWKGLKILLTDVYVLTFFFKTLLMGVGNGFVGYLFLFLSDLGASGTLLGLCLTMNCIAEIPVFFFSGLLIRKLGVSASLNLGMAAFVLRITAYVFLPNYPTLWLILPVELLQGATFALAWSAGTVHCRKIAPKHLRSTVQSIFSGLYSGVGAGIGGLAGGFLYDAFGGRITFIAAVSAMGAGWIAANATNLMAAATRGINHSMKKMKELRNSRLFSPSV